MNTPVKLEMLEVKPPPPNERLVALARDLLEGARSGRIQNLAAVWGDIDPEVGRTTLCEVCRGGIVSDLSVWAMLGGLEIAKHKLLSAICGESNAGEGDS